MLEVQHITSFEQKKQLFHKFCADLHAPKRPQNPNLQNASPWQKESLSRDSLKQEGLCRGAWIVNDLKSKQILRTQLLENRFLIEDSCVMRISELWRKLFKCLHPHVGIISKEIMLPYIQHWLEREEKNIKLALEKAARQRDQNNSPNTILDTSVINFKNPHTAQNLYDYMTLFLPALAPQEAAKHHTYSPNFEALIDWLIDEFKKDPSSKKTWGVWPDLCYQLWLQLQKDQITSTPWLRAALAQSLVDLPAHFFKYDLVVDVHSNLSPLEADLIVQLSKHRNIKVLIPELKASPNYTAQYVQQAYQHIKQNISSENRPTAPPPSSQEFKKQAALTQTNNLNKGKIEFKKLATPLAEIKHTTACVQQLISQGVAPDKIAIAAPNIEIYWPVLSTHLQQEQLPVAKNYITKVHNHTALSAWICELRLQIGTFSPGPLSYADAEACLYINKSNTPLKYTEFEQLYTHMYERKHLFRKEKVFKFLRSLGKEDSKTLSAYEFIKWAMNSFKTHFAQAAKNNSGQDALNTVPQSSMQALQVDEIFSKIIDQLLQSTQNIKMPARSWLTCLENLSLHIEHTFEPAQAQGLMCENIESLCWVEADYVFVLGLTEANTRVEKKMSLGLDDTKRIAHDLDLYLTPTIDNSATEYLQWQLKKHNTQHSLMCTTTDFQGQAQSPALCWLEACMQQTQNKSNNNKSSNAFSLGIPEISSPAQCRQDKLQQSSCFDRAQARSRPIEAVKLLYYTLAQDAGQQARFHMGYDTKFGSQLTPVLSASTLEQYAQCPFIFAAQKIFKLETLELIDLDVGARSKGSFMHKLLERLGQYISLQFKGQPQQATQMLIDLASDTKHQIQNKTTNNNAKVTANSNIINDGTSSDGTASDETASDETASDETASDETASDETISDETVSGGTVSNISMNNRYMKTLNGTLPPEYDFTLSQSPNNEFLEFFIQNLAQACPELKNSPTKPAQIIKYKKMLHCFIKKEQGRLLPQQNSNKKLPLLPKQSSIKEPQTSEKLQLEVATPQEDKLSKPLANIVGLEVPIKASLGLNTLGLLAAEQGEFEFTGSIDRVDIRPHNAPPPSIDPMAVHSSKSTSHASVSDPVSVSLSSSAPSSALSPAPSSALSPALSPAPSSASSHTSSPAPSPAPSSAPSHAPSPTPSHAPSPAPSHAPSSASSHAPSHASSHAPSSAPASSLSSPLSSSSSLSSSPSSFLRSTSKSLKIEPPDFENSSNADVITDSNKKSTQSDIPYASYIVYDYKSSNSGVSNYSSWPSHDRYQLFLYKEAIEKGFTNLEKNNIYKACYYVMKNLGAKKNFFEDHKGFNLDDDLKAQQKFKVSTKKSTPKNKKENQTQDKSIQTNRTKSTKLWSQIEQDLLKQIQSHVQHIYKGQMLAQPRPNTKGKYEICTKCDWRSVCRFKHLN